MCRFLEVEFEATMLDHTRFADRTGKHWEPNTAYDKNIAGIQSSSIGSYKNHLSKAEIFFAELITRNMLLAYGYPLSGVWLTKTEWDELYNILSDDFVFTRFNNWLHTNQGVEDYPSPPPEL